MVVIGLLLGANSALAAEAIGQKTTVYGTPTANLRAGAGVEHELKLTLKEGDEVTIEKVEGDWFLVSAADGQKGYIHKNLLKPMENLAPVPPQVAPVSAQKAANSTATAAAQGSSVGQSVPPTLAKPEKSPPAAEIPVPLEVARVKPADGKSPSLLQLLEAHEAEAKIALVVAGVAFVLGWVCGGLYSVRRERKHRRRLRL